MEYGIIKHLSSMIISKILLLSFTVTISFHEKEVLWMHLFVRSVIVQREQETLFLMGAIIISLPMQMTCYWGLVSLISNMDTFVRSWVVLFGLHKYLIVVHLTQVIWR